jgi:hypothetical protein
MRLVEIMNDLRNLQHYIAQIPATPTAEEYYLEGYSLLRQCAAEARVALAPFTGPTTSPGGNLELKKAQLRSYVFSILSPGDDSFGALFEFDAAMKLWWTFVGFSNEADKSATSQHHPRRQRSPLPVPESVPTRARCTTMGGFTKFHIEGPTGSCRSFYRIARS